MAEEQDAKRKKLEEFRSFRTSKRHEKKKQKSDEREKVKTQNCFVCDRKTQMRNKATKLQLKLKENI